MKGSVVRASSVVVVLVGLVACVAAAALCAACVQKPAEAPAMQPTRIEKRVVAPRALPAGLGGLGAAQAKAVADAAIGASAAAWRTVGSDRIDAAAPFATPRLLAALVDQEELCTREWIADDGSHSKLSAPCAQDALTCLRQEPVGIDAKAHVVDADHTAQADVALRFSDGTACTVVVDLVAVDGSWRVDAAQRKP